MGRKRPLVRSSRDKWRTHMLYGGWEHRPASATLKASRPLNSPPGRTSPKWPPHPFETEFRSPLDKCEVLFWSFEAV
jgi:hypothetical protein